MTKILRCADLIPGCEFIARGESGDEAVARAITSAPSRRRFSRISSQLSVTKVFAPPAAPPPPDRAESRAFAAGHAPV